MENYIIDATAISSRWEKCREELRKELQKELKYYSVQIVGHPKSDDRTSAIGNMNYRFAELVPKAIINGNAEIVANWYEDTAMIDAAEKVFSSVCGKYGFQYEHVEKVRDTVPVFVIKVGEF